MLKDQRKLLRRYIREAIDLGRVQFSPNRNDGVDTGESNTWPEQELYDSLFRRVAKGEPLSTQTAKVVVALLDSKYGGAPGGSGFFAEPPFGAELYRGTAVDDDWIKTHIGLEALSSLTTITSGRERNETMDPMNLSVLTGMDMRDMNAALRSMIKSRKFFKLKTPYIFSELRGWSKKPDVATGFAPKYTLQGDSGDVKESNSLGVAVVLVTTPWESGARFLDLQRSMYKTDPASEYEREEECINLEPVEVEWVAAVRLKFKGDKA